MITTPVYQVASGNEGVYVRVTGSANMRNVSVLDAFLREQEARAVTTCCIDLAECTGMDSTFMGTLVGAGHRLAEAGCRLVLVNPVASTRRLLDMLGVSAMVPVLPTVTPPDGQFVPLASEAVLTPRRRASMMKRAHEDLAALSEENRAKFAGFLGAIERDLARLGPASPEEDDERADEGAEPGHAGSGGARASQDPEPQADDEGPDGSPPAAEDGGVGAQVQEQADSIPGADAGPVAGAPAAPDEDPGQETVDTKATKPV